MRELRFIEPGRVEWCEVPEPELGSADAALVRQWPPAPPTASVRSIGLYATDVARALGATVTYVDTQQNKCEIAEKLGATVLHEPPRERFESHPVVAHTTGTEAGLRSALRSQW